MADEENKGGCMRGAFIAKRLTSLRFGLLAGRLALGMCPQNSVPNF